MDKQKLVVYYTYEEQMKRFEAAMPEIRAQVRKYKKAKANGTLKSNSASQVMLFNV